MSIKIGEHVMPRVFFPSLFCLVKDGRERKGERKVVYRVFRSLSVHILPVCS